MTRLPPKAKRLIAVGGGKGGVGKSVVAIALATEWARRGRRVVLADLDLGAANLHSYLGIHHTTPTLARFLRRETDTLDGLLVESGQSGLQLLRGADDVPGLANPQHWMKLKLLRHIRAIDADVVLLDLGAGTAFNTLDFFGAADLGLVVTEPQPAAVMNAYGFIKAAFHRRLQAVFRHHPALADAVEFDLAAPEDQRQFGVDWLRQMAADVAPQATGLIDEIAQAFKPGLIINRSRPDDDNKLVNNLLTLCRNRLGLSIEQLGQLPANDAMRRFQLNIPGFLQQPTAVDLHASVQRIVRQLDKASAAQPSTPPDLSEADQHRLQQLLDTLNTEQLQGRSRDAWKLRVFFRPQDVMALLESHGHSADSLIQN